MIHSLPSKTYLLNDGVSEKFWELMVKENH